MTAVHPPSALSLFDPLIAEWFLRSIGTPTAVQEQAWPVIARGEHALVSAPTGTGKTLAAFLWGINGLLTGAMTPGGVRILYVSPLKALNNDIQRTLLQPLAELESVFRAAGRIFPPVTVLTRSGDTPSNERQRMLRHPPEILITTPESLNLIVASPKARLFLGGVAAVILDEIHAVAGTKRGTHLITAVDRLVPLVGDFQRIALSATVKPLTAVADLIGGYTRERTAEGTLFRKRPVQVVSCPLTKDYRIRVSFPVVEPGSAASSSEPVFDALARRCRLIIAENRSTLFFVNSRRHAEKLVRFINEGQETPLAWSHHGSLSRELRLVVESRLKKGELKAIVATSSLELGIDIGSLDQVILVQTPFSVASSIQRLGRAGHRVGETSSGVLFPLHGKDIVDAAVMAQCVKDQDIEDLSITACPLDVLAQVMVSMATTETWRVDEMFDLLRTSAPYHELPRRQFDLVLDMLAGKYAETRLRDLSPLISWDRLDGTVQATAGARLRLMTGGGTIPDRGNFSLRAAGSQALIGELDEEFVWERSLGDSFVFGAQAWRIQKIDHQNVEVVPVATKIGMSPFWKAEERGRDFHFSDRISRALEAWDGKLRQDGFAAEVAAECGMDDDAARAMTAFLLRQREATGSGLPHRHRLLVEHTRDPDGRDEGTTIVLHTLWGGKVNRPFGLALAAALEERFGAAPQMYQTDDAVLIFPAEDLSGRDILFLVSPDSIDRLLRHKLEGSGFFGARFRESAGRALLLPRGGARRRIPFWLTRQRARALYAAVSRYDDFPLLLETWRTCLRDEFDLESLGVLLRELAAGEISVEDVSTTSPSPFCGELVWKQTNTLMYTDDTPAGSGGTSLRGDLVRELALSADLRPRIEPGVVSEFRAKLQRTAYGYAPRDARELLDWVKERLVIPSTEWEELVTACARDSGRPRKEFLDPIADKIGEQAFGSSLTPCVVAVELLPRIQRGRADGEALEGLVGEWLRFQGPVDPSVPAELFGIGENLVSAVIEDLVEAEDVVLDRILSGSESLYLCDRENLEILLRITRARARPAFSPLPLSELPRFVAERQGLTRRTAGPERLQEVGERLFGCPLPAHLWEEEVFPARVDGYHGRWLDGLLSGTSLLWLGCGRRRITFCFGQDVELFDDKPALTDEAGALFPGTSGRFSFWDLVDNARSVGALPAGSAGLAADLWRLAWDGAVSSDSLLPVRRGIASGFRAEEPARDQGKRRGSFDRWQASRPSSGFWHLVPRSGGPSDAMESEDIVRDRIRQLLSRYGVLFRELLDNELPPLRWSRVFRSLRLMEFSGEVVTGRFFDGVPGLQFALPSVLERVGAADDAVWWVNAADPASLCGIGIDDVKKSLPARLSTTHVVYQGREVVLVSRRRGRELEFRVSSDAPGIPSYLEFVKVLTGREQRPLGAVHVETINNEPARDSAYRSRLVEFGFVEDYRRLTYRARP